jgi:hypothetical protein
VLLSPSPPLPPHCHSLTPTAATPFLQRIWSEWQKQCLKRCDDDVRAFWVCRETHGLMAPVRCGGESEGMKGCLQACGRDEVGYAAFSQRRAGEIEADILLRAEQREQRERAAAAAAAAAAATAAAPMR